MMQHCEDTLYQQQQISQSFVGRHKEHKFTNCADRAYSINESQQKWATDVTLVKTEEGQLYLAVVLDVLSRKIVGHSTSSKLDCDLVLAALKMAIHQRRPAPGLVLHSDSHYQFSGRAYQNFLSKHGIVARINPQHNNWGEFIVGHFFNTLKRQLDQTNRCKTYNMAKVEILKYIKQVYNQERMLSAFSDSHQDCKLEQEEGGQSLFSWHTASAVFH